MWLKATHTLRFFFSQTFMPEWQAVASNPSPLIFFSSTFSSNCSSRTAMASAPSLCFRIAASPSPFISSCSHASAATTRRVLPPIRSSHRADECHSQGLEHKGLCSRRQTATASMLAALSLMLALGAGDAQARDIPIFGIRKVQKVEQEVVKEVKELVKEGVSEAKEFEEAVKETVANLSSLPSKKPAAANDSAFSPALQAGIVAGAGVVASLVASSAVDNLVSKPSK